LRSLPDPMFPLDEAEAERVFAAILDGAYREDELVPFLTTMAEERATRIRLHGLMDNRQVLVPFVNLGMLGRPFSPRTMLNCLMPGDRQVNCFRSGPISTNSREHIPTDAC